MLLLARYARSAAVTFFGNIVYLRPCSVICVPCCPRATSDTMRTQINNIPEKSLIITLLSSPTHLHYFVHLVLSIIFLLLLHIHRLPPHSPFSISSLVTPFFFIHSSPNFSTCCSPHYYSYSPFLRRILL